MTTLTVNVPVERRVRAMSEAEVIEIIAQRLWSTAVARLAAHDAKCKDLDPEIWQVEEDLLDHSVEVSRLHEDVGRAKKLPSQDLARRRIEGIYHDIGKDDPECMIYRLRRPLSELEKEIVAKHQSLSAMIFLDEGLTDVRPLEYNFIMSAHSKICFHHVPEVIEDKDEQLDAIELRIGDSMQAWTRKRHRAFALTRVGAADKTHEDMESIWIPAAPRLAKKYRERYDLVREVFLLS